MREFQAKLLTYIRDVLSRPAIKLSYFIGIYVPAYLLLRERATPLHPSRIILKLNDLASKFKQHSENWNSKQVSSREQEVKAIREQISYLQDILLTDRDYEQKKEELLKDLVEHLEQNCSWISIEEPHLQRRDCAHVLNAVPTTIRVQAMAMVAVCLRSRMDGLELYDSQLLAALLLADGLYIELPNGEGKTFVAIPVLIWAAIRIQALQRFSDRRGAVPPFEHCFLFTSNDYLVRRDFVRTKGVYEALGISLAFLQSTDNSREMRRLAYTADVLMLSGSAFIFDYLRDTVRSFAEEAIEQAPYFVLVDEVDQFLLDEAETPHILSGRTEGRFSTYVEAAWVQQVDIWVQTIFGHNSLLTRCDRGNVVLTTAGRIYIRILAKDASLDNWPALRAALPTSDIKLQLIVELLVEVPALAKQINPEHIELFHRYLLQVDHRLLFRTEDGKLKIYPDIFRSILNEIRNLPSLSEIERLLDWSSQLGQAKLEPEELHFLITARRRPLNLTRKLLSRRFLTGAFEVLLEGIVARSEQVVISQDLANGLAFILMPSGDTTATLLSPSRWITYHFAPTCLNLATHALEDIENHGGSGPRADIAFFVRMFKIYSKIPDLDYRTPGGTDFLGIIYILLALLKNALFVPIEGRLTSAGLRVAQYLESHCRRLSLSENYSSGGIVELIQTSLYAHYAKQCDVDYIVHDDKIVLVNQVSGRQEPRKHFGRSLHPFVQAKHGLPIEEPLPTIRTITTHSMAKNIPHLVGMSGTLLCDERQLRLLYTTENDPLPVVVKVPPHIHPRLIRENMLFARSRQKRWEVIANEIIECRRKRPQPILVITSSVKDSEEFAHALKEITQREELNLLVLNASREELEEEIISFAGEPGTITIATQMAARGTDITVPRTAIELGGLYVIISEFHDKLRVNIQAEGRAARHGDPGRSRFIISPEDQLFASRRSGIFPRLRVRLDKLKSGEDLSHDLMLTFMQPIIEEKSALYQQARAHTIQFDSLLTPHRDNLAGLRDYFVSGQVQKGISHLVHIALRLLDRERISTFFEIAQRMSDDLVAGISAERLVQCHQVGVPFRLILTLFRPLVQAYGQQRTPYISLEVDTEPVSLVHALLKAILGSAQVADLKYVQEKWQEMCGRFCLLSAIKPPQVVELLHYLDNNLQLGLDGFCQSRVESVFEKHVQPSITFTSSGIAEALRKSIIEVITERNLSGLVEDVEQFRSLSWNSGGMAEIKIGSMDLPGNTKEKAVASLLERTESLLEQRPHLREEICRVILEIIDKAWEDAHDEMHLIELRSQHQGSLPNSWVSLIKEIGILFRQSLDEIAHSGLEHLGRLLANHEAILPVRDESPFLSPETFGYKWIWSGKSQICEEEPPGYRSYFADEVEPQHEENRKQKQDTGKVVVRDEVSHRVHLPTTIPKPDLDALLEGEYSTTDDQFWATLAESFRQRCDALAAIPCLDLVRHDNWTALRRALLFNAFGCKAGELTYLKKLQEGGRLSTHLRLRMAYLLAHGTHKERDEALFILAHESVLDMSQEGDIDSLRLALTTTLEQMLHLKAYDAAVEFFVSRLHLLFGADKRDLGLFVTAAEILAKASEEARNLFYSKTGISWTDWLEGVFFDFFRLQAKGQEFFLLRIALFQRNRALAEFIVRRVLQAGVTERQLNLLASVFEATGFLYERTLCMSRIHLLQENYEEAIAETKWLLDRKDSPEICALRVCSLIGLSRALQDYRYGRTIAAIHLDECLDLLSLMPIDQPHVRELILEALCLRGYFAQAEQRIQEWRVECSLWRVRTLLAPRISPQTSPLQVCNVLAEIIPSGGSEELEACRIVNLWIEEIRLHAIAAWRSNDTLNLVTDLRVRWSLQLKALDTYDGFWQAGQLAFHEGVWRAEERVDEAVLCLQEAVTLWKHALERTRGPEAPYESLLKRHERLARETIEESLRRCQKRIRILEEEHARATVV